MSENISEVISREIRNTLLSFGVNPEKPTECQELLIWMRDKKLSESRIKHRIADKFADVIIKIFIAIMVLGFMTFYNYNTVKHSIERQLHAIIREENRER